MYSEDEPAVGDRRRRHVGNLALPNNLGQRVKPFLLGSGDRASRRVMAFPFCDKRTENGGSVAWLRSEGRFGQSAGQTFASDLGIWAARKELDRPGRDEGGEGDRADSDRRQREGREGDHLSEAEESGKRGMRGRDVVRG